MLLVVPDGTAAVSVKSPPAPGCDNAIVPLSVQARTVALLGSLASMSIAAVQTLSASPLVPSQQAKLSAVVGVGGPLTLPPLCGFHCAALGTGKLLPAKSSARTTRPVRQQCPLIADSSKPAARTSRSYTP